MHRGFHNPSGPLCMRYAPCSSGAFFIPPKKKQKGRKAMMKNNTPRPVAPKEAVRLTAILEQELEREAAEHGYAPEETEALQQQIRAVLLPEQH